MCSFDVPPVAAACELAPDADLLWFTCPWFLTTEATRPAFHASCASGLRVHQEPFPAAEEGRGTLINRLPLMDSVDLMRFFTRA